MNQTIKLLICISIMASGVSATPDSSNVIDNNLLIYYGYPSSFNYQSNYWNLYSVASDMSQYDIIVLGAGLEHPAHRDHNNTRTIISLIDGVVFGYVSLAQPEYQIIEKIDMWNNIKVTGIFLDESGYDFGNDREKFNTIVNYIHSTSNIIFVNAWNPNHVLGIVNDVSYPNTIYNPLLVESALNNDDWYLLESCPFYHNTYINNYDKCYQCWNLKKEYEINLASVSTIINKHPYGHILFNHHYKLAQQFNFDGQGTSDIYYGAGSSIVKLW